jgi:hypothetical protein
MIEENREEILSQNEKRLAESILLTRISKTKIDLLVKDISQELKHNPMGAAVSIAVVSEILKKIKESISDDVFRTIKSSGLKTVNIGGFQIQFVESQKKEFSHCSYHKWLTNETKRIEKLMTAIDKSIVDTKTNKRISPVKYKEPSPYFKVIIPK